MLAPLRMAEWGFADHFGQGLGQLLRLNISEKSYLFINPIENDESV